MSDGDALLRAILLNPDDDTARLVYADWLDENAKHYWDAPRAQFIREQIEFSRLPNRVSTPRKLPRGNLLTKSVESRKKRKLREKLESDWNFWCVNFIGDIPRLVKWRSEDGHRNPLCGWVSNKFSGRMSTNYQQFTQVRATRGFISAVSITMENFTRHAAAIFSRHPVERVEIVNREPDWDSHFSYGWHRWIDDYQPDEVPPSEIPKAVWEFLDMPETQSYINWKHGALNQETAMASLSRACVRYGRQQAKLPEHTFAL